MMIILVTADNYLLMFVGWEGKTSVFYILLNLFMVWLFFVIYIRIRFNLEFYTKSRWSLIKTQKNNHNNVNRFFGINHYSSIRTYTLKKNIWVTSDNNKINNRSYSTSALTNKSKKELTNKCKELTPVQQKALVGVILGDGHLQRSGETSNTSLWVDNAYPSQQDFINNIRELFDSITTMSPKIVTRVDKRSNKTSESMRFFTRYLPCLNYYHNIFYKDKVKIIPNNIGELLTEIGLAYGLMGDGFYRKNRGGVFLCTDSYTPKEVELLVETLINKFGLTASKQKRIDGVYRIYIHKKSIDTLIGLVKPYFIPSMLYKLGLNSTIAMEDSNVKVKPSLFSFFFFHFFFYPNQLLNTVKEKMKKKKGKKNNWAGLE